MKLPSLLLAALAGLASAAQAQAPAQAATEADALFANKICFACHSVTKADFKRIGPYVVDIKAKYQERADARAYLKQRILAGSSGVWGPAASSVMPPNKLSDDEADLLAGWILTQ